MRPLHLNAVSWTKDSPEGTSRPLDQFMVLVFGDSQPDDHVMELLANSGGSWSNQVVWLRFVDAYCVNGLLDVDPNYGDSPGAIDRRLREAGYDVSVHIQNLNGNVFAEGSLVSHLAAELMPGA